MGHVHVHDSARISRILVICSAVNLAYVAIEAGIGLSSGSAGLVSDAGHNLGDVLTLLLSLAAVSMTGNRRGAAVISVVNAVLLLVAVALIAAEGVARISDPSPVDGGVISVTAGIGILVNGVTAWLLMRDRGNDFNVKASFLHMLSDTLVSAGVLVSGLVIRWTGLAVIDPAVSLLVAAIILVPALRLLKESIESFLNLRLTS